MLTLPSVGHRAAGAIQKPVVQPSRGPRRFHELVLEKVIGIYTMNQRVPQHVALGVGACRLVHVKERQLTGRVGHLLSIDDERADVDLPFVFCAAAAAAMTTTAVAAAADGSRLRVAHAPGFDPCDHSFLVRAAGLARNML